MYLHFQLLQNYKDGAISFLQHVVISQSIIDAQLTPSPLLCHAILRHIIIHACDVVHGDQNNIEMLL